MSVLTPLGFTLLRQLADGDFHSGEDLAAKVGLTRARVSQVLKDAEAAGLALERVKGRGYRLLEAPDFLAADAVRARLSELAQNRPGAPSLAIEIVDQIESTSSELTRRSQRRDVHGMLLAAEWQTEGRGRRGRSWTAVAGGSLTFSLGWRFEQGAGFLAGLSLAVGVAVVRALEAEGFSGIALKWPNDLVHRHHKLGGILIDLNGDALGPSVVVVGIGVNVRLPANVRDESPGHFSDAGWAATAIEYYISTQQLAPDALSGDHQGKLDSTYAYDYQLNISFSERLDSMLVNFYNDGQTGNKLIPWNRNDVTYKLWDAGDGYVIEGRIAWSDLQSVRGYPGKIVQGTRIAFTWSLYHMAQTELSGDFKGYAYSKAGLPAWQGPVNWNAVDVKGVSYLEVAHMVTTGVEVIDTGIPAAFTLSPAYPNPFNPSTNIEYTLTNAGVTSLKVYNMLGQLVSTPLANANQAPGTYKVSVDMSGSTSGIYFVVLEHAQNRLTQKVVLMK